MIFSLITITLNGAATINRCIDSVLKQERLPDEYIFVDGGSDDGTLLLITQKMAELQAMGINTYLLQQQHTPGKAGIPEAWNQGIAQAKGDVIALLNCDDYYLPGAIKNICSAFELSSKTELVSAPINIIGKNNKIERILYPKCLFCCNFLMPIPHPGTAFSTNLYKRLGMYNTDYTISADYDMIWRCYKNKVHITYLPEPIANMQSGGLANSSRKHARKETLQIALHYCTFPLLPYCAYLLRKLTGR